MLTCITYNDMWNDLVSKPRNRSIECHLGLIPMGWLHFILCSTCVIFCVIHLQNHNIWVFLLFLNFVEFILFCLFSFDKAVRKKGIYNSFCINVKFKNCTRFSFLIVRPLTSSHLNHFAGLILNLFESSFGKG